MKFCCSIVFLALSAVLAGSAQAAYIVDTGVGSPPASSFYDDGLDFQSLGVTFSVSTAYTISSVEGWIVALNDGNLVVELISGGSPDGPVLFGATFAATPTALGLAGASWQGAAGLSWSVVPGDYTLAFYAPAGFEGAMWGSAPDPLATEWFRNRRTGGIWTQLDRLDLGIRVDASPSPIPEPGALVLLGIGLAGLVGARRRQSDFYSAS